MSAARSRSAVVVGSGPNGLAAAITLARAGWPVRVVEAAETIGGGARSAELTLPGFVHDVCSAMHAFGVLSPFFRTVPLHEHGLDWVYPSVPLAHPLDDGSAVVLERSVDATARALGADGAAYRRLVGSVLGNWTPISQELLGPLRLPRRPLALARFGIVALWPATISSRLLFRGTRARALFAGLAAHAIQPLENLATSSFALIMAALAHLDGWPLARGGSRKVADSLASYLRSLGGELCTGKRVESIDELEPRDAALFDVTPRQLLSIAGHRLPGWYRRKLAGYRYGPGVFKVDWALDGPVPWRPPECSRAGTVHVGGTLEEIAGAERAVWRGQHPERPFVLVAQQSLFDSSRAPEGKHTLWGYCHVPNGSTVDMTAKIEAQIERFAPGFRDRILARSIMSTADMERYNANYVGGDINGGVQDIRQLFTRPMLRVSPYTTPVRGIYLCSSSTPPGGGVHGLCGYFAARAALRRNR